MCVCVCVRACVRAQPAHVRCALHCGAIRRSWNALSACSLAYIIHSFIHTHIHTQTFTARSIKLFIQHTNIHSHSHTLHMLLQALCALCMFLAFLHVRVRAVRMFLSLCACNFSCNCMRKYKLAPLHLELCAPTKKKNVRRLRANAPL